MNYKINEIVAGSCTNNTTQHPTLRLAVPLIGTTQTGKVFRSNTGTAIVLTEAVSTAMHIMLTTSPVRACREGDKPLPSILTHDTHSSTLFIIGWGTQ